jgi:transposase
MATAPDSFSQWLAEGLIPEDSLTPEQRAVLHAAFRFRQQQGDDYYSTRLLSHFLLHAHTGLPVAAIARLLNISRPTASRQQRFSSKEAVQQAQHRMDGRPYGKLLPRYAGAIAEFLVNHPQASRADLSNFVERAFGVRVSRIALFKFLKKFGLDEATRQAAAAPLPAAPPPVVPTTPVAPAAPAAPSAPSAAPAEAILTLTPAVPASVPFIAQGQPLPTPAPPFSPRAATTPAPSC